MEDKNKNWQERTALMVGADGLERLKNSCVLVVGLGGVGAYAAEQLCRAGVGHMTIVDGDVVDMTNRNRQLPALASNDGKPKAEVLGKRFLDINPDLELHIVCEYLDDDGIRAILEREKFDYVVDAIDTLTPKAFLIRRSLEYGSPVISSMGAGGKFDPSLIRVSDISKSYNCNLARALRKRLYTMGIRKGIKVVFSPEEVDKERVIQEDGRNKKSTVGTISYMPPIFGCYCASVVIRDLLKSDV